MPLALGHCELFTATIHKLVSEHFSLPCKGRVFTAQSSQEEDVKVVYTKVPKSKGSGCVCMPVCSECGEVIWDLDKANACPAKETTKVADHYEMNAYHWECEPHTHPWKRLAEVFQKDQRIRVNGKVVNL